LQEAVVILGCLFPFPPALQSAGPIEIDLGVLGLLQHRLVQRLDLALEQFLRRRPRGLRGENAVGRVQSWQNGSRRQCRQFGEPSLSRRELRCPLGFLGGQFGLHSLHIGHHHQSLTFLRELPSIADIHDEAHHAPAREQPQHEQAGQHDDDNPRAAFAAVGIHWVQISRRWRMRF
jgi:hypothetical protein